MWACEIITSRSITDADLNRAKKNFDDFVDQFQKLYGETHMTINIHLLMHITSCIQRLGPTWTHSCFSYESLNSKLMDGVHGTKYFLEQIAKRTKLIRAVSYLETHIICSEEVKNMMGKYDNNPDTIR